MLDLSNLPRIDSATMRIQQALLALPGAMLLPVEEAEIHLTWHAPRDLRPNAVGLSCETVFGRCRLCVEPDLIECLSDVTLPGWREESLSALPISWRLTAILDLLLRATPLGTNGLRVRLDADPSGGGVTAIGGTLTVDGLGSSFLVSGLQCDADLIEGMFRHGVLAALPPAALRFPAVCRLGRLELTLGRLQSLEGGDVLLLPSASAACVPARVLLPDGQEWEGLLREDGTFEAVARQERIDAMTEMNPDLLMSEDDDLPGSAAEFDPDSAGLEEVGTVADLPVALDLQFHRSLVPLAEFSRLTEGSFLDLGIDLAQPVRLRANDCTVGSGHLVQIGDRVGVRIARWRFARTERSG